MGQRGVASYGAWGREAWHHMGQGGVASYGAWGREAWHHMGQGGVASYGAGRRGIIWSMGQGGVASYGAGRGGIIWSMGQGAGVITLVTRVGYLGFHISGDGIRPTQEKSQAIVGAPAPKDVSQLQIFLGLVNYYSQFLHHLANTLAPLYALLTKHQQWCWGAEQEEAFKMAKSQLASDVVLVHFDPQKDKTWAHLPKALSCMRDFVLADLNKRWDTADNLLLGMAAVLDPHHISLEWLTPTQQQTIRQQLLVVMFDVAGNPSDTNAR
ncbi:hypothetical protein EMCRGX_G021695 [Ephydatia muelleri]